MTDLSPAPTVRITSFFRLGSGWLGDPPELHPITVTDVSAGIDLPPGSQFDWFCTLDSCRLISEGSPSGDAHPSPEAAEWDAVQAHAEEGVPLDGDHPHRFRDYPDEEPF